MIRVTILAAAAVAAHPLGARDPAADGTALASVLSGELALTMRGSSARVMATAVPAESGCAALVTARGLQSDRQWSRRFRWGDVAWAGTTGDGRTMVAFHDHEVHLASDILVFQPIDGATFRRTLARVAQGCRTSSGEGDRVMAGTDLRVPVCYFPRLPGLHLQGLPAGSSADLPPRAVLNILSRENPEAELQLLLERAPPDAAAGGDDWGRPTVAFTFADPRIKDMRITSASFALDAQPVTAQHSVTAFGDTRVRIGMDPFRAPSGGGHASGFYRRLRASGEVRLTLLDAAQQAKAVMHFDTGPILAAARKALAASNWSCSGAAPAPPAASTWHRAD